MHEPFPIHDREITIQAPRPPTVLLVVEGTNDIEFLCRLSRILHAEDTGIPDLRNLEHLGRVLFIPFGGGHLQHWSSRLAPLDHPECHLYDREVPPETELRLRAAQIVNARPGCYAHVTHLRSLENYLHPAAIEEAKGIKVTFSGQDSVTEVVARASLPSGCDWAGLSRKTQTRLCYHIKRWLNRAAVDQMTVERLNQQDPAGELAVWLRRIGRLVS